MSAIGALMQAWAMAVNGHNDANPTHNVLAIGMAAFDMDRLGLEDGEDALPGIPLQADGGSTGTFRIICDGQHDHQHAEQTETVRAVSDPNPSRMDPVYS